jgi:hypothetical protein
MARSGHEGDIRPGKIARPRPLVTGFFVSVQRLAFDIGARW